MGSKKIYSFVTIILSSLLLSLSLTGCKMEQNAEAISQKAWQTTSQQRVSIHDPSITSVLDDNGKETFYVFGSHLAEAKTADFLTWEVPFTREYENMEENLLFGHIKENLAKTFEWAGHDDSDSSGGYNLWAPDVIWNDAYTWSDGSTGAYMLYYSASSTWRRSAIGLAVAKTIEGPYSYSATIVYSGFTEKDSTDGSERNTNYANTNVKRLIEEGKLTEFSDKWAIDDGLAYNTDYAPNAIDPALFYDEDGKLWMTYGSWSGGIFLLEIDQTTGQPLYPGKDSETADGRVVDRYFGTKLSGGYHQSGEGPYIVYDESTGYYYLFVTYGGLTAKGGYNMRLFRAESPEGPYLDAKGNSPIIEQGGQNSDYGIKLIGNYQFSNQKIGYRAAGHNSAIIDQKGNWYLVFHTRFNNGTEAHELRVHSMYMNEEDWPVPTPFEYRGNEKIADHMTTTQAAGTYQIINHGTDNGQTMLTAQMIELHDNGEITGEVSGSWSLTNGALKLSIGEAVFTGTMLNQQIDEKQEQITLTFSTIGNNNESIWGKKQE